VSPALEVEIVYPSPRTLVKADVLARLRARIGAVAPVDPASPGLNFYFPDHRVPFRGQQMPVQCVIEAVGPDRVRVRDLLATGMDEARRIGLFRDVVAALSEGSAEVRWMNTP
jgi:hypothetical protein